MTSEDFGTIIYNAEGSVAHVTLDRPEAANAQDTQLIDELDAAFDRFEQFFKDVNACL